MKVILLVNPTASSVTPRNQVIVSKMLDEFYELEILLTDGRGHAIELAKQAAKKGEAEAIIVLGGDGTLNEAANGVANSKMILGVLPGGSTNVFSRILGFEDDPVAASEQILNALKKRLFQSVNLGEVNKRVFLFHTGIGFDAQVVERVERSSDLKRSLAHPLFIYKALSTWFRHFEKSKPQFTVEFSKGDSIQSNFSVCMNANPYTYLGMRPLDLAPQDAGLDKKLVAVSTTSMNSRIVMRLVRKALSNHVKKTEEKVQNQQISEFRARHNAHKKAIQYDRAIDYRSDLDNFRIYSEKEFPYQVDGDFLGYVKELKFRHRKDSLQLIVPERQRPH